MYNISTLPYYLELDTPFAKDEFFNDSTFNIDINTPITDFVKKNVYGVDVLNQDFRQYLDDLVGANMSKVVIWYWGNTDLKMAHIDCNSKKEIHPFAINWVLNPHLSQVNFYDKTEEELSYGFGDNSLPGIKTENVTAYIPVDVSNSTPSSIWSTKGPCLLNTSIPHMIETPEFRISASIQFDIDIKFKPTIERILNGQ
jgi:hypothetical protein